MLRIGSLSGHASAVYTRLSSRVLVEIPEPRRYTIHACIIGTADAGCGCARLNSPICPRHPAGETVNLLSQLTRLAPQSAGDFALWALKILVSRR